ncbi:MAG: metalloregulator ArsR/SmtB family transcription factor [Gammaproteobacteria bacterium]|jgi:ArsR family transcriptional regulator, arsenate/arsenite/antimonite-responsive transcriptional repressor
MVDPSVLFKALADMTRLRSLVLLQQEGELCVCELIYALGGIAQPKLSKHLAVLREAGLVQVRREGLWVFYHIAPQLPGWIAEVLQKTGAGLAEQEPYRSDRTTLHAMVDRPRSSCCA